MSKGLELLERLVNALLGEDNYYKQFSASSPIILRDKEIIEKDLETLEALKKIGLRVALEIPSCKDFNEYNEWASRHFYVQLTKTEFNLIKEWLERP